MTCEESKQVNLEDILITSQLAGRLPKSPDFQAESQAMHTLVRQLTNSPQTMLKTLVHIAKDLCQAGSAGVSVLERTPSGEDTFRYIALAGELEEYEGASTPDDFSPCGVCLERQAAQLYLYQERYFTYFQHTKPVIVESLVIPLIVDGQPLGTIWLASHDEQKRFDSEDVRILTSFGNFAASALQNSQTRNTAHLTRLALEKSQAQLQGLIANIPGMVYRYIPCTDNGGRFSFVSPGCHDLFEVEALSALQDESSIWNLIHPDDLACFSVSVETAVKNFLPWDWQGRIITPSGELKWVQGRSNALHSEEGDVWDGLLIDITESKRAAEALRESEGLKQSILDSSTDCIKVLSLKSEILYINKGGLCLLETEDSKPVLNADWLSFWQGKDQENAETAILAALSGNIGRFQGYCPTLKSNPKWWDVVVSPVRDALGSIVQLLVISRDITKQKLTEAEREQAQTALREAHIQLESALLAGAVYTWRWQIPTNRVIVNTAFAHLFAVDPVRASNEGLPINLFLNAMHPQDRSRVRETIEQAIDTGQPYSAQYRVYTASGQERWVSARGQVEYDASGKAVSLPGALIDVTELKKAEISLRQLAQENSQQLRKFDAVMSSVPDFIYTFDLSGRFTYVNQPLLNLWQKTLAQALGKNFFELDYPTDLAKRLQRQIQEVITTQQALKDETSYTSVFGTRAYEYIFVPLFAADNTVEGVAGTTHDITERKSIEAEREQILHREQVARETAETANRIKDEFLAVLSHELRSPLNPILGWCKMLRSGKLDAAKTAHALETIERNAKLQVQLIEDLLDVARILRGKLSLNMLPVNLASIITAAIETVQLASQAKSIQIETAFDANGVQVLGDATRLQQIVWNIVSNAVKFTPAGGSVKITLKRVGQQAQIQVSDTGKGIAKDFLPHVFDYFRQADSSTTRTFGGLGLGLAIVRHLVELHGGNVQALSSGVGLGATFTVKLPLLKPEKDKNLDESTALVPVSNSSFPLAKVRILLVDDETDTRDLIAFVLEQSGAIVTAKTSAIEALHAFEPSQFDVLVSDVGMPEMDGYTLMRNIEAIASKQNTQVLAVALTAYAGEINQQQARAAGFNRHIAKPVEPEHLVKVIADLIKQV